MIKVNRVEALTFLRFVAAVVVVFHHYGKETSLGNFGRPAIISGPQMVTFFFVLSGFVLMMAYYQTYKSVKVFYAARIARIFPIYFAALVLICCFRLLAGNLNTIAAALDLFFLQSWFPVYTMALNRPAWSLSVEMFFYLTFPLLLWGIKRANIKFQTLLIISLFFWLFTEVLLILSLLYGQRYGISYRFDLYSPVFHYSSFLLGVAGGYAFVKTRDIPKNTGKWGLILLILAFALIYFLLQYPNLYFPYFEVGRIRIPRGVSIYAPAFLFLIICVARSENVITKFLSLPALVILGDASYAVYILQEPVYLIYAKYFVFNFNVEAKFYIYLLFLISLSVVLFYLIEKPGRKLILKFFNWVEGFYQERFLAKSKSVSD